jgi:hypothetical protein
MCRCLWFGSRDVPVCCRRERCWATGCWAYLGHQVGWKISSRIQVFGRILDMIFVLALFSFFFLHLHIYTIYTKVFWQNFWVFSWIPLNTCRPATGHAASAREAKKKNGEKNAPIRMQRVSTVPSAMQNPRAVQKIVRAWGGVRTMDLRLGPRRAFHSSYGRLLYRWHPQSYLIRENKKKIPLN